MFSQIRFVYTHLSLYKSQKDYVGLYDDSEEIEAITGVIKERISIGICGSFTEYNKPILDDLKNYLKANGYIRVFTAEDFPTDRPRTIKDEAKYADALNTSIELVNNCDIIIIFFFTSSTDPEVNQSAISEITVSYCENKQNVIVLYEKGFRLRTNIHGMKVNTTSKKWWEWDDFFRHEIQDYYYQIKQICHGWILERFVKRDAKRI